MMKVGNSPRQSECWIALYLQLSQKTSQTYWLMQNVAAQLQSGPKPSACALGQGTTLSDWGLQDLVFIVLSAEPDSLSSLWALTFCLFSNVLQGVGVDGKRLSSCGSHNCTSESTSVPGGFHSSWYQSSFPFKRRAGLEPESYHWMSLSWGIVPKRAKPCPSCLFAFLGFFFWKHGLNMRGTCALAGGGQCSKELVSLTEHVILVGMFPNSRDSDAWPAGQTVLLEAFMWPLWRTQFAQSELAFWLKKCI